jgi:transcriptional regulator with XRE-family HTH domain
MPRRRDQELLRDVGQRVAKARRDRGWTQEQLAEAITIEPVSLSRLETGDRALSLSTLASIADLLQVSVGDLLDVTRSLPETTLKPDEAELLRLFQELPEGKQDILLRLARDLSRS